MTMNQHSAASDLGLHCLPRSQKRDARLIWVNCSVKYFLTSHIVLNTCVDVCWTFLHEMCFGFHREMKCNGINGIRRLATYHKETLTANLHPVIVALLAEVGRREACGMYMKIIGAMLQENLSSGFANR